MRIESPAAVAPSGPAPALPAIRRPRVDKVELLLLAAFAAISMWVVATDVWEMVSRGIVWTGTDGYFIVDQLQYLAWIQSASQHLLISNLFVLRPTPSDYFQPAIAISGGLTALGVAPWLALMLWKPVAVVGTFLAVRAYAHRTVDGRGARRAVIALGLFFGSFTVVYGVFGVIGDMVPSWLTWGYPFGLIAVALVVFALLGYERARTAGRLAWAPGLMGAVASLLHPWQGETLVLIVLIAELIRWREHRDRRRQGGWRGLGLPVVTLVATGVPLLYYFALGHFDLSWTLARDNSRHAFSFWSLALGVAPLAIFATLGYRGRPRDFLELMTRTWPLACVLIYFLSASTLSATPLHAFNGITAPLAVLAVTGVQRAGWRRIPHRRLVTGVALAAATIPANAYLLATSHTYTRPTNNNANYITRDERDAISYLQRDPTPGSVLTQFYLGELVPGFTGRQVAVGDCLWSEPRCIPHSVMIDSLFDGTMSSGRARRLVTSSGVRFLLASCKPHTNLQRLLGSMIVDVHRFGCAAVYELGQSAQPTGPLAELAPNAAVRAPRRQ